MSRPEAPAPRSEGAPPGESGTPTLTAVPPPEASAKPGQPGPGQAFLLNLVALGLAGTLGLWWVLHYTQWFPEIGGFLALGGALSWLAFVLKLLSEERTQQLQAWLDARVLSNPATLRLVALGLGSFTAGIFFLGTVELAAPGETVDRSVEVRRRGATQGGEELVPAKGTLRLLFLRWPFTAPELEVRVAGYPERHVSLSRVWWRKTLLRVPESFLRPVLLIRPEETLANRIRHNPIEVKVSVRSGAQAQEHVLPNYRGEAFWVGCDADVEVPAHVRVGWTAELGRPAHPLVSIWSRPRALEEGAARSLQPGDTVEVSILGQTHAAMVAPVSSFAQFPQEEVIHP